MNNKKQIGKGNYLCQASNAQNVCMELTGYGVKQASTGDSTTQTLRGDDSKQASTGLKGKLIGLGENVSQVSVGSYSHHVLQGTGGVLAAIGSNSTFRATEGTIFCLVHYVDNRPVKVVSGVVGENGILANETYTLDKEANLIIV